MPLRTFNPSEIAKLKQLMNEGIQVTGEVEALREGLKDTVKAISEEMDMKPATLNKAIRIAYTVSLRPSLRASTSPVTCIPSFINCFSLAISDGLNVRNGIVYSFSL